MYAKFWTDPKVRLLSTTEKMVALYCLTSSQTNRIGYFHFSIGLASEDLEMSIDTLGHALDKVCRTLGWEYDGEARVLWIPTWWHYNHPNNQKHLIGCLTDCDDVPRCPLLNSFAKNTDGLDETLATVLLTRMAYVSDTVSPGYRIPLSNSNSISTRISNSSGGGAGGDGAASKSNSQREVARAVFEQHPAPVGFDKCAEAVLEAVEAIGVDELRARVIHYGRTVAGRDEQYIKLGCNWFSDGFWKTKPRKPKMLTEVDP